VLHPVMPTEAKGFCLSLSLSLNTFHYSKQVEEPGKEALTQTYRGVRPRSADVPSRAWSRLLEVCEQKTINFI